MRSNVFDYDFFKQAYVEELVRQVLPDVKVNNVVPWFIMTDGTLGVNWLPPADGLMYFGFITGGHSTHTLINVNGISETVIGTALMPYPLLFKGFKTGALNYNNIRFVGWRIMVENKGFQLNPPKPPSTPPVIDGFDLFLFELDDRNPLDQYNSIFTVGKVSVDVLLTFTSIADGTELNLAYPAGGARYLQLHLPFDITSGVNVKAKTISSGVNVYDEIFDYGSYPFSFVANKPGADLVLTFTAESTHGVFAFNATFPQVSAMNQADFEPIVPSVSTGAAMIKTFAAVNYLGATELAYGYQCQFKYVLFDLTETVVVEIGHEFLVQNQAIIP